MVSGGHIGLILTLKRSENVKDSVLCSEMPNLMQFTKGCIIFGGIWDIFPENGKFKMASGGHIGFL